MDQEKNKSAQYFKIGLAVLVILGAGTYAAYSWKTYTQGSSGNRSEFGRRFSRGPGGPPGSARGVSKQDRRLFFEKMSKELGVTPEQKTELAKLRGQGFPHTPEEREKRLAKLREILTPEQMQGFRKTIGSHIQRVMKRRLAKAKRTLPPDQYKLYEERWNQRARQFKNLGFGGGRRAQTENKGEGKR